MKRPLKIIIADDHEVLIDGLIALFASEPDIQVVGKALNGKQLLEMLRYKPVDLVIMDIDMPQLDGVLATKELKEKYPAVKVLVLTMYNTPEFVKNLLRNGADGYMLKYAAKKELIEAVRSVANNQFFYTPEIADQVMNSFREEKNEAEESVILSEREKEIITQQRNCSKIVSLLSYCRTPSQEHPGQLETQKLRRIDSLCIEKWLTERLIFYSS